MISKLKEVKGTLEAITLIGYAIIAPTIEKLKDNVEEITTILKHPVVFYIAYLEEKSLKGLDYWERMDSKIKEEQKYSLN